MNNKEIETFHHYGSEFNTKSARIVLPYLKNIYNFQSVVDIGCGIETWLKACRLMGINDVLGIDGAHVLNTKKFLLPEKYFLEHNFFNQVSKPQISRKYDLAICLEVAEHLRSKNANEFVKFLTTCSDVILFSAAIPGQTGENHRNEQLPNYWVEIFKRNGYVFLDPFRKKFWKNKKIEWWYRQNMFLVVNKRIRKCFTNVEEWDGNVYVIFDLFQIYTSHKISTSLSKLGIYNFIKQIYSVVYSKLKQI